MFDDFLMRALLAGILLSFAAGPLGCFIIWRRMAYFGDATAHAAILGVVIALAFQIPIMLGVLFIALSMAFFLSNLQNTGIGSDTSLGVFSHGALALGLVFSTYLSNNQLDLTALLMGDILATSQRDLVFMGVGALLVLGFLYWRWPKLLLSTLSEDIAISKGISPKHEYSFLVIALAITVALAIKIVGALLISALLIIPTASARFVSRSPEMMAIYATIIAIISTVFGLLLSMSANVATGPAIIVASFFIFLLVRIFTKQARNR